MNFIKNMFTLCRKIEIFNINYILKDNKAKFIDSIYFFNYNRIKIISKIIIVINSIAIILDWMRLSQLSSSQLIGGKITFYSHIVLSIIGVFYIIYFSIRKIKVIGDIRFYDKVVIRSTTIIMMGTLVFISIGDEIISNTIIVYFVAIFLFSMFILQFNIFSTFYYLFNMLVVAISIFYLKIDIVLFYIQFLNIIFFTTVAWIMSRYQFYQKLKEFLNITEKESLILELKSALDDVNVLSGLLPICSSCKMVRDDKGYWSQVDSFFRDHSDIEFSHSICPDCAKKLYPDYIKKLK
jgi:hypothetical protein